jgi:hypothetical protein
MINAISNTPNVWTVSRGRTSRGMSSQSSEEPHLHLGLPLQVASSISRSLLRQPGGGRHCHRFRQHDLPLPSQAEPQTRGWGTHGQLGSHRNPDCQRFQVPPVRPEDLYACFLYRYPTCHHLYCTLFGFHFIVLKTQVIGDLYRRSLCYMYFNPYIICSIFTEFTFDRERRFLVYGDKSH